MFPLWPSGLAGISSIGLFTSTPEWVDLKSKPGMSSQVDVLGWRQTLSDVLTLRYFIWSPNLFWFSMALVMHLLFPYDLRLEQSASSLFFTRFLLNTTVALVYYGYFHIGLYWLHKARRKYKPGSYPTAGNMLHNMYYWMLGMLQWTFWECVMIRLWATGTVQFKTNEEVLNDPQIFLWNVLWILLIPLVRDLHFYVAHRFLHIRALYRFVHKLHHRNADPEPFSGLTMHPIEHLYYYSNAFIPALYLGDLSPLVFLFCFIHLTISPGAGHSGWEDHFQADQYHYVHHAKFECNYGSPFSAFIDQFFGTFREKLGDTKEYKGEWKPSTKQKEAASNKVWSSTGYLGMPVNSAHAVYTSFWIILGVSLWQVLEQSTKASRPLNDMFGPHTPKLVASIVAYSPVIVAMLLCAAYGDRMSWRWPFHKEKVIGTFGFFLVLGWLGCILPVYHAVLLICAL